MTAHLLLGALVGLAWGVGVLLLLWACWAVACVLGVHHDDYAHLRTEGMGDPLSVEPSDWEPTAEWWDTPIYNELCFERWEEQVDA